MPKIILRFMLGALLITGTSIAAWGQSPKGKKVLMVTDMEGVSGIFSIELQCEPWKSPRWEESRKLETGEVNAAVDGLFAGGATEVIVWDGHDSGRTLSVLDIDPRVRLLQGSPVPFAQPFDKSVSALVFIGQHAMAGAKDGILTHTMSASDVRTGGRTANPSEKSVRGPWWPASAASPPSCSRATPPRARSISTSSPTASARK